MPNGGILDLIDRGKITVVVDGSPLVSVDGDLRSLDLEVSGLERTGLKLSHLIMARKSSGRVLLESSRLVKRFVKKGWKISLYDRGEHLLSAGRRSNFGTRLWFNPLKIRELLKIA